LVFTITDSGVAFDPTQVKEADTTLSAGERPIGGLGIFLIKKIMNEVEYQRVDGNNVLNLKKILQ
jgi:serine/threonine-protein kinase RsbW